MSCHINEPQHLAWQTFCHTSVPFEQATHEVCERWLGRDASEWTYFTGYMSITFILGTEPDGPVTPDSDMHAVLGRPEG